MASKPKVAEFLFKMYNVKGVGLPAKDKTTSDPYFEVYFGQVRKYKSSFIKKTLNPEWDCVVSETFVTQRSDLLNKQYLKISVKDHDYIGSDDFIGSFKIDFQTLASGPVRHEMSLFDGTRSAGKLIFCCEFQERSNALFTLRDVVFTPTGASGAPSDGKLTLDATIRTGQDGEFKATSASSEPFRWRETQALKARVTIRDLIDQFLYLRVFSGRTEVFSGDYLLNAEALVSPQGRAGIPFTVTSTAGKGTLAGTLVVQDMPTYAQMKEGARTDDEFKDCQPLFKDLPTPAAYRRPITTIAATQQQSQQQGQGQPGGDGRSAINRFAAAAAAGVMQQNFAGNFSQNGGCDVNSQNAGSNGLPPGWDEYTDPSTGHKFYINKATGVSQWERPVDPNAPTPANAGGNGMYPQLNEPQSQQARNVPGDPGLPPGFKEERDPQGRVYYVNLATGASQWERPGGAPAGPAGQGGYPGYSGYPQQSQGLPPGFKEERDPQGRVYYVNLATGASQWERPGQMPHMGAPMGGPMGGGYPGYPGYQPRYY